MTAATSHKLNGIRKGERERERGMPPSELVVTHLAMRHHQHHPNKHNLVGPRPVSYRRGGIISASYYCNGPAAGRCSSNLGIRVTRGSPPAASRVFPGYSLNTWHRSTPPQAQPSIARTHYVTSSFLESDFEQFNYHTQVAWPTQKCHVATRASSLVMAVSKQRSVRENV